MHKVYTEMHIVGGVIKPCISNFLNFKSSQTAQYMYKTMTVVASIFFLKTVIQINWKTNFRQGKVGTNVIILKGIFSSPEPKARVSYCRPFSSVVRRPSCVVRRASCVVRRPSSVNFLHFHLLLENAWLDFNQTWQESSLGVGDSKLFK